ncbi:MAG: host attachment family protein [Dokdonella sp.]
MEKIPAGTWVVVADGEGARVFHNVGKGHEVSLVQKDVFGPTDLLDDGPSGNRPSDQTDSQTDEATFAKQLAHRLNAAALKHEYEHLVLIADPHTLGEMRPQLHKETVQRIVRELAKTFTNAPLEDVERALA